MKTYYKGLKEEIERKYKTMQRWVFGLSVSGMLLGAVLSFGYIHKIANHYENNPFKNSEAVVQYQSLEEINKRLQLEKRQLKETSFTTDASYIPNEIKDDLKEYQSGLETKLTTLNSAIIKIDSLINEKKNNHGYIQYEQWRNQINLNGIYGGLGLLIFSGFGGMIGSTLISNKKKREMRKFESN